MLNMLFAQLQYNVNFQINIKIGKESTCDRHQDLFTTAVAK